jgi:hypothetical protein
MSPFVRFNTFWAGLVAGILFPAILFFLYWALFHHQISFPGRFIHYLRGGDLLANVIKMCGLANLLLFYVGLNKKMDSFNKGLILSVFLYVLLVAYVIYFLDQGTYA